MIRYSTHYELDYNDKQIEISINPLEMCLICRHCESMKCRHVLRIWGDPAEEIHLKKLRFLNPIEYL